jgi:3-dehydroquinate synthase
MKIQKIKFKELNNEYSIFIGNKAINLLSKNLKIVCPKAKKIALLIDTKIPNKIKKLIKNKIGDYELLILPFTATEKNKSLKKVSFYLNKILSKNFNRSDVVISVGGGITGDVGGFVASIFKRGINFINIPTTLLAQVDSAVGGKTGVNSNKGKNLIGSFYQPKLVISDTSFLSTLRRKEMVCGYAEILKHSIIKERKFFNWLKKNSKNILERKIKELTYAIKKSCQIKMFFVKKDINEKGLRMSLNFGHTFAHAIEVKNNYSKKISHGEAVLTGMILAIKLSILKKNCSNLVLDEMKSLYIKNNLTYTLKNISNPKWINSLIPFLKNDKKNNDDKINFLLLKKIGKIDLPGKFKMSSHELKKYSKTIARY